MPERMSSALSRVLTAQRIRRLAGASSFARGQAYQAEGRVVSLVQRGDTLTAVVTGAATYDVRLEASHASEDHFSYRCTCPVGAEGAFCKHCAAVALAWLDAPASEGGSGSRTKDPSPGAAAAPLVRLDDLHPWLLDQPTATLAAYLLEAAERDDRLREKLLRAAARATAKGIDITAYRCSLERATDTGGFVDYYGAGGYAEGVREAVEPLRELLADTPAQATAVIGLVEFALKRVERALEQADDSNGEIGSLLHELQELHLAACRVAQPDPEELATRLFEWEMTDHWEVFYQAAETYAAILGASGLATYRRLAEAEWAKMPALKPGDRNTYESPRFRLTSIMESLARISGDMDALVAIKSRDLSSAYCYLTIAELYRDAERPDDALAWAERGLAAFPRELDPRLAEFLADEYHRRDRSAEATTLLWRCFEQRPSLESYSRLKHHATLAHAWPAQRQRALDFLRRKFAAESARPHRKSHWAWETSVDCSLLVEILLWENDAAGAWAAAQAGGCSRPLWLRLAATRAKDHPGDAIPIYLREAETLIEAKNNRALRRGRGTPPMCEGAAPPTRPDRRVGCRDRALARTAQGQAQLHRLRGGAVSFAVIPLD